MLSDWMVPENYTAAINIAHISTHDFSGCICLKILFKPLPYISKIIAIVQNPMETSA